MSSVNVIWFGENFPGSWDQEWLVSLLFADEWVPPRCPTYDLYPVAEYVPDGNGAIVIFPAAYFPAEDINDFIAQLPWCFIISVSDEEATFPHHLLVHPHKVVWAMTPDTRRMEGIDRAIGEFYPIDVKAAQVAHALEHDKPLDWFFAGQVTHERRDQCVAVLGEIDDHACMLKTEGFGQGYDHVEYYELMSRAKAVPCPSGPKTQDSFRFYEALEFGAVPIADDQTPGGFASPGLWNNVFGDSVPFPIIKEWDEAPAIIDDILSQYPVRNNICGAWWQGYKRWFAYNVMETVERLQGWRFPEMTAADNITVIIPTSPIPSHPSPAVILNTIASIRAYPELAMAEIIIVADGVSPEMEHRRAAYEEYLHRLLQYTSRNRQIIVKRLDEWGHQANAMRFALEDVTTPLVLFVEHDMLMLGPIPWGELVPIVLGPETHAMRFHFEAFIPDPHQYLMLDMVRPNGVPLMRTMQWSQRPHLVKTAKYSEWIARYFGKESRTMIEDCLHGVVQAHPWDEFRLTLYHEKIPVLGIKRAITTDGRGDDPKGEMRYAYDGPTPFGAPAPT